VVQGRFKAILVDKDNYLMELARYVALNPLRAKLVDVTKSGLGAATAPPTGRHRCRNG